MNATSLPLTHSRTNLAVPIAALLAGAALSAGVIALADTDELASPPAKVIVLDAPPAAGQGVQAKNEAAVASAIAIGPELRGSKASAIKATPAASAPQADDSPAPGVRGLASSLANR
jgi:hypothetical protein